MSIEEARNELAIRLSIHTLAGGDTRRPAAEAAVRWVEKLIDAKLDARLSPAPVGGETESFSAMAARLIREADIVHDMNQRRAPTPPPAEPDGGGVGDAGWAHEAGKELQIAYERAESISPLKLNTALRHGFEAIADLEQRLAGAKAGWDMALATLAERDRRIADLTLRIADADRDLEAAATAIADARALLSPATDKGEG